MRELALEAMVDLDAFCQDDYLEITFEDSKYVDQFCNAVHEACVKTNGEWKCCKATCPSYGCSNKVVFKCGIWDCVGEEGGVEQAGLSIEDIKFNPDTSFLKFTITKNEVGSQLVLLIVIKDSKGKIYYYGNQNLDVGSTGAKLIALNKLESCEPEQKLQIVILAYKLDLTRVGKWKSEVTC